MADLTIPATLRRQHSNALPVVVVRVHKGGLHRNNHKSFHKRHLRKQPTSGPPRRTGFVRIDGGPQTEPVRCMRRYSSRLHASKVGVLLHWHIPAAYREPNQHLGVIIIFYQVNMDSTTSQTINRNCDRWLIRSMDTAV